MQEQLLNEIKELKKMVYDLKATKEIQKEYLDKKSAMRYAGISNDVLHRMIVEGLPVREYGRRFFIKKSDIDDFMDKLYKEEL